MKTIKDVLTQKSWSTLLSYVDADPDKNIPKVVDWVGRFDQNAVIYKQFSVVKNLLENKESNWYHLVKGLYSDIDASVRKKLMENFLINASILGSQHRYKAIEENQCNIPWAILMDPTSACNIKCTGCWAADYGNQLSLSLETLDDIIKQGKELGTYMYIFSGGEPLIRKDDIFRLCEKHNDCAFLAFTNGTLINEAFAKQMLQVKNFIPAISVEGFERETDDRRGKGAYQAVLEAMAILREYKLLFGISCCYTSKNVKVIGSEAYFDEMIAQGAKFAWFFTYIPIGMGAIPELMATAEQRQFMYNQIRSYRKTKPIFTMDFWNDGEYIDGCIAGARRYLHINANGDIEPCAFIHYSDVNIYEKTLLEAYKSPLFMQYRKNQPFNNNHLRPCPLLDNPEKLVQMVEAAGAESTDLKNKENVRALTNKCQRAAEDWSIIAEEIWANKAKL